MNSTQLADSMLRGSVGDLTDVRPQYPGRVGTPGIAPQYVGMPVEAVQGTTQAPVQYSDPQYVAGDVTYLGFNATSVAAGATGVTVTVSTQRPFKPQKMGNPSTTIGLLINQVNISGTNLLSNSLGVPIELFSEVSTFPQINWPTLDTATGVDFVISNPTGGALIFSGAFYGTQLRR